MAGLKKQHVCIKFCFKLGLSAMETFEILEVACGEQALGRTQLCDSFSKFKSGGSFIKVSQSAQCPLASKTDENVGQVKWLVLKTKNHNS
jgi:hypothetical protein